MSAALDPAPRRRVRALVTGRVQGVAYRRTASAEALRLGLAGWVRNLPDGRVEVLAEGPAAAVEALLAWARRGPPRAAVADVAVAEETAGGDLRGFDVRA